MILFYHSSKISNSWCIKILNHPWSSYARLGQFFIPFPFYALARFGTSAALTEVLFRTSNPIDSRNKKIHGCTVTYWLKWRFINVDVWLSSPRTWFFRPASIFFISWIFFYHTFFYSKISFWIFWLTKRSIIRHLPIDSPILRCRHSKRVCPTQYDLDSPFNIHEWHVRGINEYSWIHVLVIFLFTFAV